MRVTRAALAVVAAGAGACSFTAGKLTTSDAPTADVAIDEMIGIDADLDPDGDGVLSPVDNCPAIPNSNQHDEDSDGKGDKCDPCPQGDNDTDTDGDNVGDGCDPHPATGGDTLVRFEGFGTGTGVPPMWTALPGGTDATWSVASDSLSANVTGGANYYLRFDAGGAKTTVDIGAALDTNGASAPVLSGMVDVDATVANSYSCAIRFDAGTYALVQESNGSYGSLAADSSAAPGLPDTYRIRAMLDATGMSCDIKRGAQDHPLAYAITPNQTGVAIRVRDIKATIHYVAIYTSP